MQTKRNTEKEADNTSIDSVYPLYVLTFVCAPVLLMGISGLIFAPDPWRYIPGIFLSWIVTGIAIQSRWTMRRWVDMHFVLGFVLMIFGFIAGALVMLSLPNPWGIATFMGTMVTAISTGFAIIIY